MTIRSTLRSMIRPALRITGHLLAALAATTLTLLILVGLLLMVELTIPLPLSADSLRWLVAKSLGWPMESLQVGAQVTLLTGPQAGLRVRDLQVTVEGPDDARSLRMANGELRLAAAALVYGELGLSLVRIEDAALRISRLPGTQVSDRVGDEDLNASIHQLSMRAEGERSFHLEGTGQLGHLPWKIATTQSFPVTALRVQGQLGATDFTLDGTLQQSPLHITAEVTVKSPQFYELARYSPLPLKDFGPLSAAAEVEVSTGDIRWNLRDLSFQGGRWQGTGRLQRSDAGSVLEVELHTPELGEPDLRAWLQQSLDPSRMQPGKLTRGLLGALRTTRGKVRISAPAVKTALPLAMDKLSMQAAWQDAKLQLEHSQRLAGETLTATGRGRFSGNAFHLQMSGHLQNLTTASLAALPLPAGLTGASGRLDGTLSLVIPTATGLVKSTTATLDASELGITLTHEGLPDPLALKTLTGTIGSAEPLTLKASGVLGESPLTTEVSITRWSDLVERHASPFALQLALGKTSLGLRGEAALGQSPTLAGRLTAHLPQSGAHQPDIDLAGQLSHQGQDWQLALDTIRAGLSEGNGTLRLATGGKTATVDADLRMGVLYLADFGVTLMPPETQPPAAAVDALPAKAPLVAAPSVVEAETWLRPLRALFRKLDGRLNLVIDRWHLHDMQGPARLQANLQDSRLELALTDLQGSRGIQDGTASGTLVVNLSHPREVDLALGLRVSNGHYHLAREAAGEVSGTLDLDLALATRGVPGEGALARALNGQLRFMAVPDRGEFLLLDYWGGGLLQALAQSVGAMESSRINCAAGRMTIVNGRLTALPLILDGTRVRVNASLEVGFPGGTLIGHAAPLPKQPKLFRAWLPVSIGGTLAAPTVAADSGAGVVTAARLLLAAPALVTDILMIDEMPENGLPDCEALFAAPNSTPGQNHTGG